MKEQDLRIKKILKNLYQNDGYARLYLTISRFEHDIDANYVGFCSKILDVMVSTSRNRHFEAEKWFFCTNAISFVDIRERVLDVHPYLYSKLAARWRLSI